MLTSMTQIMQRITELTVQASNDTLAAADRDVIGAEVRAMRDELLKLTNTRTSMATIFSRAIKSTARLS